MEKKNFTLMQKIICYVNFLMSQFFLLNLL